MSDCILNEKYYYSNIKHVVNFVDGPYGIFAGRDASRGLATFALSEEVLKDGYDDLSDLSPMEMDSVREWETQFMSTFFAHSRFNSCSVMCCSSPVFVLSSIRGYNCASYVSVLYLPQKHLIE